jgi:hypothetical protein
MLTTSTVLGKLKEGMESVLIVYLLRAIALVKLTMPNAEAVDGSLPVISQGNGAGDID